MPGGRDSVGGRGELVDDEGHGYCSDGAVSIGIVNMVGVMIVFIIVVVIVVIVVIVVVIYIINCGDGWRYK